MANALTQNPIVVTTAMTQGWKASVASTLGSSLGGLRIRTVYWDNPAAVGDTVSIIDPSSSITILAMRCNSTGAPQIIDWEASPERWRDFEVNTISSGTLYIYFMLG